MDWKVSCKVNLICAKLDPIGMAAHDLRGPGFMPGVQQMATQNHAAIEIFYFVAH
jgi:hypothetical protein